VEIVESIMYVNAPIDHLMTYAAHRSGSHPSYTPAVVFIYF